MITERDVMMSPERPKLLTGEELTELGLIQEANRLFFHPLGLSLAREGSPDADSFVIQDYRHDPEGVSFLELDKDMCLRFMEFSNKRHLDRYRAARYIYQDLPISE